MRFVDLPRCVSVVFPFIHAHLSAHEPAPPYDEETEGLKALDTVLTLAREDRYYPTFAAKAAYLFCALAGAQHFTNGNKRLAVGVLLLFLVLNRAKVRTLSIEQHRDLVARRFPDHQWEPNPSIPGAHALFLYNLAIIAGDRPRWGVGDFPALRGRVERLFGYVYKVNGFATDQAA
jgi:prophage maintenance system killer protein